MPGGAGVLDYVTPEVHGCGEDRRVGPEVLNFQLSMQQKGADSAIEILIELKVPKDEETGFTIESRHQSERLKCGSLLPATIKT